MNTPSSSSPARPPANTPGGDRGDRPGSITSGARFVRAARRWLAVALTGAIALASAFAPLTGCGGGVGEGGTGYASGPITGFGSVIVNGITFDDSTATIEDGEGDSAQRATLRLGMTVEVESDAIRSGSARAARVRFDSAIRGTVESVDGTGFVVLGQRVAVDATTVYGSELALGLAAMAAGQVVEVYGLFDAATASYRATRVERRLLPLFYRLRGVVSQIDRATHTLRIGNALFAYASAASEPADLAVGSFVRVWVSPNQGPAGRWVVQRFGEVQRTLADVDDVSVKGLVTRLGSATDFSVDGRPVDARAASVTGGTLALGLRVEVTGSLRNGAFVATAVVVRSDDFERERGFELRGNIESVAADRSSFVLRGVTVGLSRQGLRYENGDATSLVAGRAVEVKGFVSTTDGARLDAVLVKFK